MASSTGTVHPEGDSNPSVSLSGVLQRGLAAVVAFSALSLLSSSSLFIYLTYKLLSWQLKKPSIKDQSNLPEHRNSTHAASTFDFLPHGVHACPQKTRRVPPKQQNESFFKRLRNDPPNQFLMLIYNLLFADIQQAIGFMLNVIWLTKDSIDDQSSTCSAQGWFVSVGDLAGSVFITAIGIHTYLGVVKKYMLPSWAFYTAIGSCWAFTYGMNLLAIFLATKREHTGMLYARAGAWCWISHEFHDLRLWLHYLWIFIALVGTSTIYIVIFTNIQAQNESKKSQFPGKRPSRSVNRACYPNTRLPENASPHPRSSTFGPPSSRPFSPTGSQTDSCTPQEDSKSRHWMSTFKEILRSPARMARERTFLLYPIIYVVCTVPLAAGRLANMAGKHVPPAYYCFAGALIACNGWLDALLYSTTRRGIVFSSKSPGQEVGLKTFAFMRTSPDRRFGNVVFVSGGVEEGENEEGAEQQMKEMKASTTEKLGRWSSIFLGGARESTRNLRGAKTTCREQGDARRGYSPSRDAAKGMTIQVHETTTVVIEVEGVGTTEKNDDTTRFGRVDEFHPYEGRR